jgi:hypothetical protein
MIRRFPFRLAFGLVFVTGALFISRATNAAVIYGDIAGDSVFSGYNLGPSGGLNNAIAEGFKMTGAYNLNSVDLILSNFTPVAGSNFLLSIYSDAGNQPGLDLYDLSTNVVGTTSGTPTQATFTGTGSFLLNAGTTYWLDLPRVRQGAALNGTASLRRTSVASRPRAASARPKWARSGASAVATLPLVLHEPMNCEPRFN